MNCRKNGYTRTRTQISDFSLTQLFKTFNIQIDCTTSVVVSNIIQCPHLVIYG